MGRALVYCFAGAGIGFLAGFVIVGLISGPHPPSDAGVIGMFVGTFLAGTGAIAGAILGAVAEFIKRNERETVIRESKSNEI
jgi:hypothetical protein